MSLALKVISESLQWSSDTVLKNHCEVVLNSYLDKEPNSSEEELRKVLKTYLMNME